MTTTHDLEMAAALASTSYRTVLTPALLREILLTGLVPAAYQAHMMTLLGEVPLEVLERAMREVAGNPDDLAMIQRHVKEMSASWKIRSRTSGDYMSQTMFTEAWVQSHEVHWHPAALEEMELGGEDDGAGPLFNG